MKAHEALQATHKANTVFLSVGVKKNGVPCLVEVSRATIQSHIVRYHDEDELDVEIIGDTMVVGSNPVAEDSTGAKQYFTFGQDHSHNIDGKVFDKDCVCVVRNLDYRKARALMTDTFGYKWAFGYIKQPDMKYYPRGFIHLN